jgi:predicted RNase H-like HicB family nuclease
MHKANRDKTMTQKYLITLTQGEDGYIIAECPALPGCVTQGKTREEAEENIKEAILGILEARRKHGLPEPPDSTIVQIEVAA